MKSSGYRSFGGIAEESSIPETLAIPSAVSLVSNDIMGSYGKFQSPFGSKPVIYADWTASGRCLAKIETYIQDNVLKFYGNTHTTSSITGHQSTCFRHESRQLVAQAVNAKVYEIAKL
jgi:hypothetical protein